MKTGFKIFLVLAAITLLVIIFWNKIKQLFSKSVSTPPIQSNVPQNNNVMVIPNVVGKSLKVIYAGGASAGAIDAITGCNGPAIVPVIVPFNDVSLILEQRQDTDSCGSSANTLVRTQYGWFSLGNNGLVAVV